VTLPIALSVPHAGLQVPSWLSERYLLSEAQTVADGDVGAFEIYSLQSEVTLFARTPIARAVLDMNRAAVDVQRADGVVKTHSCWQEPVWSAPLVGEDVQRLLDEYHEPYHRELSSWAGRVKLGVDCHTMSGVGPPIGPDAGCRRPLVCLSDGKGATCPASWVAAMHDCLSHYFGDDVAVNTPFAGGHITRTHGVEMPWVQLELSRTDEVSIADKRAGVQMALRDWCRLDLQS
jgi:N-formylglutamate deformylase